MEERWGLDGVENIPKLFALGKQRAEEEFPMLNGCFLGHQRQQFEPYTLAEGETAEIPREYTPENT